MHIAKDAGSFVLPERWLGTRGGKAMDYVVLNLYDGIMDFFKTEDEALRAATVSLEQNRHLNPWAYVGDESEVLVMQVTRRLSAASAKEGGRHTYPAGKVNRMNG
jgi:hypothetical protein